MHSKLPKILFARFFVTFRWFYNILNFFYRKKIYYFSIFKNSELLSPKNCKALFIYFLIFDWKIGFKISNLYDFFLSSAFLEHIFNIHIDISSVFDSESIFICGTSLIRFFTSDFIICFQ